MLICMHNVLKPTENYIFLISDFTLDKWMKQYGWKRDGNLIVIASQDEKIKTKNITEKIEFDNLGGLMAQCL